MSPNPKNIIDVRYYNVSHFNSCFKVLFSIVSWQSQSTSLSIMDNGLTNLKRDYVIIYYRLCLYNYNILWTQPKREIKIFSAILLKNRRS